MNNWGRDLVRRQIAVCLVLGVAAQFSYAAPAQQARQDARTTQVAENTAVPLPDAPEPQQQEPPAPQQQAEPAQQNSGQKPVGTAVAPVTRPAGVAGTRPSGAAIAPAKQRRVRRILIRVAVVVGAAVAIGTVVGLSRASSSRP